MKRGCAFLCDDVLGCNSILDVFAGGVFPRFLAAASTISVTLSRDGCLSWGKTFSGIRGCMSICSVDGECIATAFSVCGLGCSSVGDCEYTGVDLATSRPRPAGADEVIGVILLVLTDAVDRPTACYGVKILKGAGKKLRQSS